MEGPYSQRRAYEDGYPTSKNKFEGIALKDIKIEVTSQDCARFGEKGEQMSDTKELMIAEERSVADVRGQVNKIQSLMKDIMQKGQHYGVIPGTGSKPSLLKPGAEKLCFVFRYAAEFTMTREDFPEGHREFVVTCTLKDTTGRTVAQGVGSCSTMEKKYRYRKTRDGQREENPDIADTYNTVLKMAKKRAHVDATITACAASDIFTQDIEDFKEDFQEERNVTEHAPIVDSRPVATSDPVPASNPIADAIKAEISRFIEIMGTMIDGAPAFTDEEKAEAKKRIASTPKDLDEKLVAVKDIVASVQAALDAKKGTPPPMPEAQLDIF